MENVIEDGKYFKELAEVHEQKLRKLIEVSEVFLNKSQSLSGDYKGLIVSAVGKTKLLVNEKIDQFYGLCHTNMNPIEGELPINSNDLAGFWDLIMIELRLTYKNFKYIADCAKENWKKPLQDIEILEEKRVPSKTKTKTRNSYPAVKSVIGAELKKLKNQSHQHKTQNDIEILWESAEVKRRISK